MPEITIKRSWTGFLQRLITEATKGAGCSIVTIALVVDSNGEILFYREPERVHIEPMSRREQIVEWFAGEQRQEDLDSLT